MPEPLRFSEEWWTAALEAEDASNGNVGAGGSGTIKTHMQRGLVVARLRVGTRVFICQGPPIEVQLVDNERPEYVWCPAEEVQKNARFASMEQDKRTRLR